MFKKITLSLVILIAAAATSNCGTLLNQFSATKGLHGFDHNGSVFASTVRSEAISDTIGSKKGTACQTMFLFTAVAFGDASLPEARRNGGISKVNHIAYEKTRILSLLYNRDCIIVYGE
ncbi:TRL domain-containing protein [Leptospira idonii]|uniref:TRL-like family protein n=1 Tax=Leptospira idonii TaxID=1193500 RepID=A0A4R9LXK1_9LEPT|nr:TRL domain-containing protein [Leptospira idonii]TGN19000.1 hypothetical protein EHS15_11355 [Leptospira idonii]